MEERANTTEALGSVASIRLVRIIASFAITAVAGIGLLVGGLYLLLTLLFFDNFNLANFWHLFVLAYTLATPVLSAVGLLIYWWRRSPVTATVAIVLGLASICIPILWGADGSRGLIH